MKVEGLNITINDSVYNKMSIVPKGACEQDSYSGKNKVDYDGTQVTLVQNTVRTKYITPDNFPITLQAGTYVISFPDLVCVNSNYTNTLGVQLIKAGGENIPLFVSNDTKQISFTLNEELNFTHLYLYIRGTDNSNATATFSKIQIESGSTSTDFEKYVGGIPSPNPDYPQDIRVVTGDNSVVVQNNLLGEITNFNEVINGKTFTNTNGIYTIQGYANQTAYKEINITPHIIEATDKLYLNNDTITNNVAFVFKYDNDSVSTFAFTELNREITFTAQVGKKIVAIRVYTNNLYDGNLITFKPLLVTQSQTYTLHLGTEYLAGIGDYKDEIVGKIDEWKIRRKVRKVNVKDLSFDIPSTQPTDTLLNMFRNQTLTDRLYDGNEQPLCNYLTYNGHYGGTSDGANSGIGFWFLYNTGSLSKSIYIIIPKSIASNTTELINWANTNNVALYYELQEPTEIPITDTTLITDLNNMYNAMGYDGTTNITITSDPNNAQMTAEVTYTSESDMCEKLLFIFNKMKDKLYHIIRSL